jgi:hypothetical protein
MAIRKSRNQEDPISTREDEIRAIDDWTPPAVLDAPPPREGMHQHWVSTQILGEDIPHHVTKRLREGWAPRPADTVPKEFPVPTITQGQWEGFIGVEGMLLCEMPVERVAARTRYFKKKTGELDRYMDEGLNSAEARGGVPIERERHSTVSGGKRIADD